MVYLFVILAILCLAVKGFCGKKTSIYAEKISYAFLLNLVRMLLCIVVGLIVLLIEAKGKITGIDWRLALIALTGGAGTAMLVVCWVLAIRENTLVRVDVACTVASLLPAVLSLIFFKESFSGWKMFGFALILSAVFIVSIGKGGQKGNHARGRAVDHAPKDKGHRQSIAVRRGHGGMSVRRELLSNHIDEHIRHESASALPRDQSGLSYLVQPARRAVV